ncbi:MAG: ABC transporter ATP-binding protein [Clostridia bacterium]|nr:ABC transporter ATP-binding protein [Clostridia bacterium]
MKTVVRFFREALHCYRKEFLIALLMALFSAAYGVFIPLASKRFIQLVSENYHWLLILQGAGVFCGLYLIHTFVKVLFYRSLDQFGGKYMSHLSRKMESKLQQGNMLEIQKKEEGTVRNILFSDVLNIFTAIGHHIPSIVSSGLLIIALLVFLFINDVSTALLICVASALGIVISIFSKKYITSASKAVNLKIKGYDSCCTEYTRMLPMVQTNPLLGYYQEKTDKAVASFIAASRKADVPIYLWSGFSSGYYSVFSILLSAVLVWPVAQKSVVDLVFFTLTANIIIEESQKASQLMQQIIRNLPSFSHAADVLALRQANGEQKLTGRISSIEFRDVAFSYSEKTDNVLRGISCEFRAGDTIRVKGANGSGKSTFYKLLTGLYQPESGTLEMNGMRIQDIAREELNRAVLYINQDEKCLNETISDYLSIISGKQVPDEKIREWLKEVRLEDTRDAISGNGDSLSGGQRKKLYVLKLLAAIDQASVIILDEIAAGMDKDTVAVMREIVKRISGNKDKIIFITDHGDAWENWPSNSTFIIDRGFAQMNRPA